MTMDERIITFFRGTSPKLRNLIACGVCVFVCCGVLAVGTPGFITGVVPNIYIYNIYIYGGMGGIVRRVLCVWAMRVFLGVPVDGRTDLS